MKMKTIKKRETGKKGERKKGERKNEGRECESRSSLLSTAVLYCSLLPDPITLAIYDSRAGASRGDKSNLHALQQIAQASI